ncbi:MAG TPA: DNA mismatch repair endonuclease MutL [Pirellulales bacterium]|nr:DNA mismatch repair endonuclease MutL [Pirellulales bacterium]
MATIRQLPQSVINKIAAGEVVERPASVVKELVENSLDAGATRIEVSIAQGGMDLVRIVDNGHGIPAEQLPLAVASHATSKLATADDLFRVSTLGFRGEALASIAEVSHFTLRSRTADATAGAELEVIAGEPRQVVPCGCAPGTAIEVRNLFVNTPVRRKFLRSTQTEMGHVTEAFTRLALASPQVHFVLRHNERLVYDLPPSQDWRERIGAFFGPELSDALIWIDSADQPIRLAGYVAHPSQSRGNTRMQYLFLNGRYVRDRALQHALAEAYRGLLLTGRYPISFLCFDMPAEMVDVNVHPTKLEVRFQDGGRLYSQLLGTIRTKFLTSDLTHAATADRVARPNDAFLGAIDFASGGNAQNGAAPMAQSGNRFVEWAKSELAARRSQDAEVDAANAGAALPVSLASPAAPLDLVPLERHWDPAGGSEEPLAAESETNENGTSHFSRHIASEYGAGESTSWNLRPHFVDARREFASVPPYAAPVAQAVQIHNRYLVTESAEGVLVIDQHALHERVLYEQFRAKVLAGALETQSLLVPEPVDLTPAEAAAALEQRELLAQLGIRIEPFGGGTVLVSSYPAMLKAAQPAALLRDMVELLVAGGRAPERRDLLDELLHMMSCKAAVKAGDALTPEEIEALLASRHLAQDTHHCPHGRPTALVFTREDLDRQFMRT